MLYSDFFQHSLTRKYIVAFMSMFTGINVVRRNSAGAELHRERVPLMYAQKEKYIQRLISDAALNKDIAIKLPTMSVELVNLAVAPDRRLNAVHKFSFVDGASKKRFTYAPVTYDMDLALNIYTKTTEEGLQIIEQIMPAFAPDYTVSLKPFDNIDQSIDVSFAIVSVALDDPYDGAFEDNRVITWSLSFVAKVMYFGPTKDSKKIRAVLANLYDLDTNTLMLTDVYYGTDEDNIDDILDWDGEEDIPGTTVPSSTSSEVNTIAATRGTAISETIQLLDSEDNPVDLTGVTPRAWMRRNIASPDFIYFDASVSGDATNGQVLLDLDADTSEALSTGAYIYEIDLEYSAGNVVRGGSGGVTVSEPDLT